MPDLSSSTTTPSSEDADFGANDWLLEEMYEQYSADPGSVDEVWAAYFTELFPVRLRPMGASLFHGGHVISLGAPLIVTTVAAHASLGVGMALAPATFLLGAGVWALLPETLRRSPLYRGFDAEAAR